ncbi:MAG: PAS domain-containing sensor histidine kinase [Bacteroidetes bacterium]|nr:MAG: PAS domain-containing sensor histidine kinase [Bacteroidota bacterium]TAG86651.1 MAG: PAS domain-containing sensor histidine kinase [Bacteroidota bacterium]
MKKAVCEVHTTAKMKNIYSDLIDFNTLTAITEDAALLMWMTDSRSRCIYASENWLDFTGKSLEQILGLGWTDSIHPDDLSNFSEIYFSAKKNKKNFELECRFQRNDGKYKRFQILGNCRYNSITKEFLGYVGVCNDITTKQKQLEASQGLLDNVVKNTDMLVVALDREFRFLMFNDAHAQVMKNLFGIEPKKGDSILEKIKHIPEAYQSMKMDWEKALKGEKFTILENFKNLAGETLYYEVTYSPVFDNYKKIIGATAISRDITERKKHDFAIQNLLEEKTNLLIHLEQQHEEMAMQDEELRQTNEELFTINNQLVTDREKLLDISEELQARNFELDQIMYKTSHDIRSPITSVLGLLNLLDDEEKSETITQYLSFLRKRVNDLDRFTKMMLEHGKSQRAEVVADKIDFELLINHALDELKYHPNFSTLKLSVNIKNEKNIEFKTDEFRLKIVLANLISNAIKYQNTNLENSFLDIDIVIEEHKCKVVLKDNGIGIEEKYISKIFDMFFRATDKCEGSGLGMYIVKQTIKKLEGNISLESELNKGTTVSFELANLG